jgi:YhcH/YjgK/YiaL family protein
MIFDQMTNHQHYHMGPAWLEAFSFLDRAAPALAPGKYHLRGDLLFAIVMDYLTQFPETGELEAHRRYLDIQTVLRGSERVTCHFVPDLQILHPYDPLKDAELYRIPTTSPASFILSPGTFLALFPHDAHNPCLMLGDSPAPVRKVVIKVAIDLLTASA